MQQDVFRLDVAVHDPLPMGIVQRVGYFTRDPQCVVHWKLLLAVQAIAE